MKVVLHVGCGKKGTAPLPELFDPKEWQELRLDIDPATEPDIISSITDMAMVPSESVDAVFSQHNLEHLQFNEVPIAIREFYRVIKVGGFALIGLPDIKRAAEEIVKGNLETTPLYESPAGPIYAIDLIYGHRDFIAKGNPFMIHKTGFTAATLEKKLHEGGFSAVVVKTVLHDLLAMAKKL